MAEEMHREGDGDGILIQCDSGGVRCIARKGVGCCCLEEGLFCGGPGGCCCHHDGGSDEHGSCACCAFEEGA